MSLLISIVVLCFNEQDSIPIFYEEVSRVFSVLDNDYELLFVNDASSDNTLNEIRELTEKDSKVKYISFSRNFGKESVMYAGFCNVKGDYVAVMEVDMQDTPSLLHEIVRFLEKAGYDSVATRRVNRTGEPIIIRSWFARKFYKIINLKTVLSDLYADFEIFC